MLIRIVRMYFTEEGVEAFLQIFNHNKNTIRNFEGCEHLELLTDLHDKRIYTTISYWQNEAYLNAYRKSNVFEMVWKGTKKNFSRQPEAFSLTRCIKV